MRELAARRNQRPFVSIDEFERGELHPNAITADAHAAVNRCVTNQAQCYRLKTSRRGPTVMGISEPAIRFPCEHRRPVDIANENWDVHVLSS
jgi:hypothetical protein